MSAMASNGAKDPATKGRLKRLPRGPHKLAREEVISHQRERLVSGAASALAEYGYASLTVEHVIKQAHVSRAAFYQAFTNKHNCFLVAHEVVFERLFGTIVRACVSAREWPDRVVGAIHAVLGFVTQTPDEALLLVLDAVAANPAMAKRVTASHERLASLLRGGRQYRPQAAQLPELTERALIGATTSLIGARLMRGEADCLAALEPQLVELILTPYVGAEEAARVARGELVDVNGSEPVLQP